MTSRTDMYTDIHSHAHFFSVLAFRRILTHYAHFRHFLWSRLVSLSRSFACWLHDVRRNDHSTVKHTSSASPPLVFTTTVCSFSVNQLQIIFAHNRGKLHYKRDSERNRAPWVLCMRQSMLDIAVVVQGWLAEILVSQYTLQNSKDAENKSSPSASSASCVRSWSRGKFSRSKPASLSSQTDCASCGWALTMLAKRRSGEQRVHSSWATFAMTCCRACQSYAKRS